MEETVIDRIRTRPRFRMHTETTPEKYESVLKDLLKTRTEFSGNVNRETATVCVKSEVDHYYKPCLTLRAEKEDGLTVIRGIFGPSSAVWTFFMFLYFIFGILWMVFITLWFVGRQIKSDDYGWCLGASFGMLACIAAVYFLAQLGQKKAKPEMELLRSFAMDSVKNL